MTLAALKTVLQDWAQSTEATYVANLDTIIGDAEQSIYDKIRVPSARIEQSISTVAGTNTVTANVAFGASLEFYVTAVGGVADNRPLELRDPSYIRECWGRSPQGKPLDYAWLRAAVAGSTLLLGPTPDAIYAMKLEYYSATPESLVTTTSGTWLSINFPDVLRKHAQYRAGIFLKMWEQVNILKPEAEESLQQFGSLMMSAKSDEHQQ